MSEDKDSTHHPCRSVLDNDMMLGSTILLTSRGHCHISSSRMIRMLVVLPSLFFLLCIVILEFYQIS